MRIPKIRAKVWGQSLSLKKDEKTQNVSCSICRKICMDEKENLLKDCRRLTRSVSKWMKEMKNKNIIIYETYRCMPLLGDEKLHAPDWEEHIVRSPESKAEYGGTEYVINICQLTMISLCYQCLEFIVRRY